MIYIIIIFAILLFWIILNPQTIFGSKPGFASEFDVLSIFNKGFCLTGKNRKLTLKDSFRHSLVVGQSGSGKSQCSFLPILLRANGKISYVVHDPSGEISKATMGYLSKKGYQTKIINLAHTQRSDCFNPLKRLDKSYSSAKRLANIIVSTSLGDSGGDKFWNIKGEQLLSIFIAVTKQLNPQYHHMGTVLFLLNKFSSKPSDIDVFVAENCKDDKLFEEYKSIIATDPKLLSNIISTAKASLSLFEDEGIMKMTSFDDINFSDLRKTPTVIFLQSSIMQLRYHAPLFSMVLVQMMESLISKLPNRKEKAVMMLLDEAGILQISNFSNFLSNSRKYLIGCLLGVQTLSQIKTKYGIEEGNNIIANTFSQLYFSNQPIDTCQVLEKMGGYCDIEVETENGHKRMERRLVLPAHEIRTLDPKKAILMVGGLKPILCNLSPAYNNFWLSMRMNLPYERRFHSKEGIEPSLPYIPTAKKARK